MYLLVYFYHWYILAKLWRYDRFVTHTLVKGYQYIVMEVPFEDSAAADAAAFELPVDRRENANLEPLAMQRTGIIKTPIGTNLSLLTRNAGVT